jgi:hypothetical protein
MPRLLPIVSCAALVALAACENSSRVAVVGEPTVQTRPRSEPVFYNGKTYRLDYDYAAGAFNMRVSGMGPKQEKDAAALATSSLRYFACLDGQSAQAIGAPTYAGGVWNLKARCV